VAERDSRPESVVCGRVLSYTSRAILALYEKKGNNEGYEDEW